MSEEGSGTCCTANGNNGSVLGLACLLPWRSMVVKLGPVGMVLLLHSFSNFLVTQITWQTVVSLLFIYAIFKLETKKRTNLI